MVALLPESVVEREYLLFCDSVEEETRGGRWRFVLESTDGAPLIEASDYEEAAPERIALLSVVRGLEALEGASQVTLLTSNRYVTSGLRRGLTGWRETNFHWEHFGLMRPIQNADLWRRVDRALEIHEVHVCSFVSSPVSRGGESALEIPRYDANERLRRWLMLKSETLLAAAC